MPLTVGVNAGAGGLTLCHKGSNGISIATVPDVCKTPPQPLPVPYPNVAYSADLAKGTTTVKADGGNMCAKFGSEFSKSTGDEPGSAGGVKSGTFIKEATWITFSFDVKLEGKGACRLTDKMFHNHQNTVNASGLQQMHLALARFKEIVCPILCKVAARAKKEKLPKGKSTWTQVINDELKKHADDLAKIGARMEKSVLVAAARGSAARWGRKALGRFGPKGLIKKAGANVVPVVGQAVSIVWTAADVGMTVWDTGKLLGEAYELLRYRPDFMIQTGGETLVGEIKLEATKDFMRPGQQEALDSMNGGKKTPILSETTCDCPK